MRLCIAEKPSVAKEIASILQANTKKDGYFEGNGYYVSWTFGHLCTLKEPDDYQPQWKRWDMMTLPIIPEKFGIKLISGQGYEKQFNTIKYLIEHSEEVINCGDAGIEGELIQRWVLHHAKSKLPLKRLWISSLTEEALKEGFQNLKNGDDYNKLYAAGYSRSVGDWLLGMNASRLYTLKYSNGKGVLSIGRVQTPTLALIVERYNEIQNFVPQPYWEIKTNYRDVLFNSTKGKYSSKEEAEQVLEQIKTEAFEIISYTQKKGNESPPKLFDLTALQVECNKRFDFTADDTLKYIQSLYEKKLVTYPRVDTTFLPTDMYPKIEGIMKGLKPYENFTSKVLSGKISKSKKIFDDTKITDHHAIVPTGISPGVMPLEEKKVFDTIARRFISVFYPDCIVMNTTVLGESAKIEFKATGKVILEPGWRELYPKKQVESNNEEDQILPEFTKGETGPHIPDILQKETTPPKFYTEATLLRAMETAGKNVQDEDLRHAMKENGIGRPSTRANIIETLFKRKYITRQKKNLVPTATGVELIATIKNDLLKSVELTGLWESKLRKIERGEYEASLFMDEMKKMVSELVQEVRFDMSKSITIIEDVVPEKKSKKENNSAATSNSEKSIVCPKCGKGSMLKGKNAYGCSEYKNGCSFIVKFEQFGKKLSDSQLQTLFSKKKSGVIKGFVVDGVKSDGNLSFNNNFEIIFESKTKSEPAKPKELHCPVCKTGTMLKGNKAYGCSRFKDGCKFLIPFDALQEKYKTMELTVEILKGF